MRYDYAKLTSPPRYFHCQCHCSVPVPVEAFPSTWFEGWFPYLMRSYWSFHVLLRSWIYINLHSMLFIYPPNAFINRNSFTTNDEQKKSSITGTLRQACWLLRDTLSIEPRSLANDSDSYRWVCVWEANILTIRLLWMLIFGWLAKYKVETRRKQT